MRETTHVYMIFTQAHKVNPLMKGKHNKEWVLGWPVNQLLEIVPINQSLRGPRIKNLNRRTIDLAKMRPSI